MAVARLWQGCGCGKSEFKKYVAVAVAVADLIDDAIDPCFSSKGSTDDEIDLCFWSKGGTADEIDPFLFGAKECTKPPGRCGQ